jgi:hypothetical protein
MEAAGDVPLGLNVVVSAADGGSHVAASEMGPAAGHASVASLLRKAGSNAQTSTPSWRQYVKPLDEAASLTEDFITLKESSYVPRCLLEPVSDLSASSEGAAA